MNNAHVCARMLLKPMHSSVKNIIQWNPVNTVTNGPKDFGRNNEVTILTWVSLQENVWSFLPGGQEKVAGIMRWP